MSGGQILTVNTGSSSIKAILTPKDEPNTVIWRATVTGIGQTDTKLSITKGDNHSEGLIDALDHTSAIDQITDAVLTDNPEVNLVAVGHRIVHIGRSQTVTREIDDHLLRELDDIVDIDPDHAPATAAVIRAARRTFTSVPHIACFDTTFFADVPRLAQLTTLPYHYETRGLRRYGFHGLSYEYLTGQVADQLGDVAKGRIVYAHLGSGVSLAAVADGKPIDMTMGVTPASGIMMSSRSGDIDPGIVWQLYKEFSVSPEQFNHIVNHESGLLGVSGTSADMYTLLQQEKDDSRSADAVNLFCYQARKAIASLATTMGGLDSIVFSGGIGEQSAPIRSRIADGLEFMGVMLDQTLNNENSLTISASDSSVGVYVIPTDENIMIAKKIAVFLQE